jgi:hypothetical protein
MIVREDLPETDSGQVFTHTQRSSGPSLQGANGVIEVPVPVVLRYDR